MKVIKKVNNNVAICLDNNQNELIAFGKGIGFPPVPYELNDLSNIHRTYYGINSNYLGLLHEIPENIFEISAKIVDIARNHIENEVNSNIVFTLADHINFAIQRYHKDMKMKMPFSYDIQYLYETEMKLGEMAVNMINKELCIHLSSDEAISIALHFINAQCMEECEKDQVNENELIKDLTIMIENKFHICIDRKGFNYSRFVTHLQYLLKRRDEDTQIDTENKKLYEAMMKEFPETNECVLSFGEYLTKHLNWCPSEEENYYI